jgi:formate hydrogenlyase transcriptional activator
VSESYASENPPADSAWLLRAAREVGGELDLDRLVHRLRPWLTKRVGVNAAGVAIVDDERDCVTSWRFECGSAVASAAPVEWRYTAQDLAPYAKVRRMARGGADAHPLDELLAQRGDGEILSIPVMLGDRWLGFLFASFNDPAKADRLTEYYTALVALVAPIIWNCHNQARFQHGDQRRATLISLSDAINRSLKLATVLDSTRLAMRSMIGHIFSAIMLVDTERGEYVSYLNAAAAADLAQPARHPLAGSVLERVLATECSYQSDDLDRRRAFAEEERYHALGVRRCVAAPMFVRGRIIGCLLVGARSATRALKVDVWLYENIALQLALAIDNARQLERVHQLSEELAQQNSYLREEIQSEHAIGDMIGDSAGMRVLRQAIARVGPTDSTVLITGETGVGKELVARAIHDASPRAKRPMVKVNCAAIPEGMVESELFGHERGAFTSAVDRRIGRFELANEGTLFLDEVGELSPAVQAKLLRVLQDGAFERVGGTKTLSTNARIIAATNRDLARSAREGLFRSDLYYRLNVFPLHIPALRERSDDIPALVWCFIDQFNRRMGKHVSSVDPAAMADLTRRPWPGNIRELRHEVERAMIMSDGAVLRTHAAMESPTTAKVHVPAVADLQQAQAEHIRWALTKTGGIVEGPEGAAKLLGINPSTLRFRMKRLGINRPS